MLFAFLSGFQFLRARAIGDVTDRLHYYLTSNLLAALAILISWKQFGGRPIECMVPEIFNQPWEQYAENFCWVESTYYVPFEVGVPTEAQRAKNKLSYYQWVPFYLLIAAVSFQVPCAFWNMSSGHSGLKISDLIEESGDRKNLTPILRQETLRTLTVHIENGLRFYGRTGKRQITPHSVLRPLNLPYTAVYVSSCYLLTKIFYLCNVLAQFGLMNQFLLTSNYTFYGYGAVKAILNGTDWQINGIFPLVTLCDMKVRQMGQVQRHSFQCMLTINLLNEKIFIFLWVWFWLLFLLTVVSFLYWSTVLFLPCFARGFVTRHLALSEQEIDINASRSEIERFIRSHLHVDGVFILRMVTFQAGVIFGSDLTARLSLLLWT